MRRFTGACSVAIDGAGALGAAAAPGVPPVGAVAPPAAPRAGVGATNCGAMFSPRMLGLSMLVLSISWIVLFDWILGQRLGLCRLAGAITE